jgi:glycogen(starch) synthase
LRILLITSRYLPHHGGLETVVHELASHMQSIGHDVQIVTQRSPHTLPPRETLDQIRVTRLMFLYPEWRALKTGQLALWLAGFLYLPLTFIQLYNYVRRFKPDVINFHYVGNPALFVWLVKHLYHVPLIVSLHGADVDAIPFESRFKYWLFKAVMKQATQITACSRVLLNQALKLSPGSASKARVIHNGVDAGLFAAISPYSHPRPYVFAVGQLGRHKGFDILIDAFTKVSSAYSDIDLLIAGEGSEKKALQTQIQSAGLTGRAVLLGGVSHDQVAALMCGSLLIAVPSRREPFGIVGLEAMASGRPMVVRRVDGLVEALDGAILTWVDDERSESLADALRQTLASATRDHRVEANQQKAQNRSWATVAEQYLDLFTQILSPTA